ncbi:MAG: peptidoglycan binding domain-containing protein, partial [Candidatus Falkowbacteria bacterium]|nr:peptidoglycan binding domain-containing protein [Candidatus Falkowbacteria bacterium]
MDLREQVKSLNYKWLIFVIAIFLISAGLVSAAYFIFVDEYRDKIYPHIFIGQENVGGLTKEEAIKKINYRLDEINQNGIIFDYLGNKTVILPIMPAPVGEFTEQVMAFDLTTTVDQAFSIGHGLKILANLKNILWDSNQTRRIPLVVAIDQEKIKNILQNEFSAYEQPAKNASLIYEYSKEEAGYKFSVTKEEPGQVADYDAGLVKLADNLANLDKTAIVLASQTDRPAIYQQNCLNIETKANNVLTQTPFNLKFSGNSETITKPIFVKWLALVDSQNATDKVAVGLDTEVVKKYLVDNISPQVNKQPQNSKFIMNNGRVTEFQSNQDGVELDLEASFNKIKNELANGQKEIELVINTIRSEFQNNNVNELGIEEIIGTGKSNFAGSPKNRRHNIQVGANDLHGMVIKPGEEFAVMKSLGTV